MEYWDLYDSNRKFMNKKIARGKCFPKNAYHVVVHVWFINARGEILVTRRDASKRYGLLLEGIGGSVMAGETSTQAAVREVQEEIGLTIKESELVLQQSVTRKFKHGNDFLDVYIVNKELTITDLTLETGKVVEAFWITPAEYQNKYKNQEFVPTLPSLYQ